MVYTLYDATITQATSALKSLRNILEQGQKQDPEAKFLGAQIHEDMKNLSFQVTVATVFAERMLSRLSGGEEEKPAYDFQSYAATYDHINHAIQRLEKADRATVNGRENEVVSLVLLSGEEFQVTAQAYATGFALPHIYFHVVTAYDILRKEGVPLGKRAYIGSFVGPYLTSS